MPDLTEERALTVPKTAGWIFTPLADSPSIEHWEPEDEAFWETTGKKIAARNLVFSIFAELLGFSVWQVWSAVASQLPNVGYAFTVNQLFWLAALPGLSGATLRVPYSFAVSIFGG